MRECVEISLENLHVDDVTWGANSIVTASLLKNGKSIILENEGELNTTSSTKQKRFYHNTFRGFALALLR